MTSKNIYEIATKHDIVEGAPNRTLESAILIMGTKNFRRLPITKLGKIRGILTVTDIIRAISQIGLPEAFNEDISKWMTETPQTIDSSKSILDAAKAMHDGHFGSLLIIDEGSNVLKAIVTERDILRHYRNHEWNKTLADLDPNLLTSGLVKIDQNVSLEDAIKKMDLHHSHRILTFDGEELSGILTANDITNLCSREREEISQNPNFLKSITANYVATNQVKTIDIETPLSDVISMMCDMNIGSVPVMKNNNVFGIFSERSLIHLISE